MYSRQPYLFESFMKENLSPQQNQDILKALDDAIEQGPWEDSNFLRVIGKNLRKIREDYANHLAGDNAEKIDLEANLAKRVALRSGQQEIFIALYSSEGGNLHVWERILSNLPNQIISRPIYTNEEDVRNFIKSKENKNNEAYVSIFIDKNAILTLAPDKTPLDKFGKTLLNLKDRALHLENINHFVHGFETYQFIKGKLIKSGT
jgi:intracellular multiplication protein IcmQ